MDEKNLIVTIAFNYSLFKHPHSNDSDKFYW